MIFVIDLYNKLHKSLNKTKYEFILDKKYLEILNICETFLSSSGGSSIPEDFLKIDIIEIRPIFRLINFSESPEIISENVKTNLQSEKMVKEKIKFL